MTDARVAVRYNGGEVVRAMRGIVRIPCLLVLFCAAWAVHAQDARTVQALADMRSLAQALELCAADTGFFVSLETLNDSTFRLPERPYDYLHEGGGVWVIRPAVGRFEPQRRELPTTGLFNAWRGPYINFQEGRVQTGPEPYDVGSPLDPWGMPYLFYTPLGLVRGDSGTITLEWHGDRFDRYMLVSLGPDGVVSGDDLTWVFGGSISAFALSSLGPAVAAGAPAPADVGDNVRLIDARARVFAAPAGAALTLRGLNLGASPEGARLFFGDVELTGAITDWRVAAMLPQQRVEIDVQLPDDLRASGELCVRRGNAETNALTLVLPSPNAATHWRLWQ